MDYYAGIDGGSTYLKAVLINDDGIVDTMVVTTGIDCAGSAKTLVDNLRLRCKVSEEDIKYTMATGYSRKSIDIADDNVSEITAHAYGIRLTAPENVKPGLIIDIGGQDCKIIYLDKNYGVKNFAMNDKCAAGTGKFLEVISEILETTVGEIGEMSLKSEAPCDINSMCVVFAQSEVISLLARKFDRNDILSGIHISMAKRVSKMIRKAEIEGDVVMTGGGALNCGLHRAFEDELLSSIHVARYPQFNGALGAALIALRRDKGEL
jgi:predicted CoA-substrate-specific enzyme activase